MAISSSGLSAVTGSEDTTAKLSNLVTGKASAAMHSTLGGLPLTTFPTQVLGTLNAHTASVESVGFCDEAAYAATASLDGRVIVWDIQVRWAVGCVVFPPALIAICSPLAFATFVSMMLRCPS